MNHPKISDKKEWDGNGEKKQGIQSREREMEKRRREESGELPYEIELELKLDDKEW